MILGCPCQHLLPGVKAAGRKLSGESKNALHRTARAVPLQNTVRQCSLSRGHVAGEDLNTEAVTLVATIRKNFEELGI